MNQMISLILEKLREPGSRRMFVSLVCGLAIGKWVPELEESLTAFTSEYAIEQLFAIEHLYELFLTTIQVTAIFLMVFFFLLTLFDQEKWFWLFLLIPASLGANFLLLIILNEYSVGSFEFVFIGGFSVGAILLFIAAFRQWWQDRSAA